MDSCPALSRMTMGQATAHFASCLHLNDILEAEEQKLMRSVYLQFFFLFFFMRELGEAWGTLVNVSKSVLWSILMKEETAENPLSQVGID